MIDDDGVDVAPTAVVVVVAAAAAAAVAVVVGTGAPLLSVLSLAGGLVSTLLPPSALAAVVNATCVNVASIGGVVVAAIVSVGIGVGVGESDVI